MASAKFDVEKFTSKNNCNLWRVKMLALLTQQAYELALEGEVKLTNLSMEGSTIHWFNLSKQAMIERYKGQRVDGSPAKWKKCQRVHSRIWIHFVSGGLASRRTIPLTHITDLRWWSWLEMWRWMCEKPRRLIFMEQRTLGGKWWWIGERWLWTLC